MMMMMMMMEGEKDTWYGGGGGGRESLTHSLTHRNSLSATAGSVWSCLQVLPAISAQHTPFTSSLFPSYFLLPPSSFPPTIFSHALSPLLLPSTFCLTYLLYFLLLIICLLLVTSHTHPPNSLGITHETSVSANFMPLPNPKDSSIGLKSLKHVSIR